MDNNDYYGAPTSSKVMLIKERLREKYLPDEFVTVMNIDTKPLTYQFAAPQDVETFIGDNGEKNTVEHRHPQRVTLQPGDTKLAPAYEADLMIEALIKQMAMSSVLKRVEAGELADRVAASDWTSPEFQNNIISQAFIGKKDILNMYNTVQPDVSKDLDLDEPTGGRTTSKAK